MCVLAVQLMEEKKYMKLTLQQHKSEYRIHEWAKSLLSLCFAFLSVNTKTFNRP